MKQKILLYLALLIIVLFAFTSQARAQCNVNAVVHPQAVCAGEKVSLSASGGCGLLMGSGFDPGTISSFWSSTSANPVFTIPCGQGPSGIYGWVGTTPSYLRTLTTVDFDVSLGNCELEWYMRYGAQIDSGDCENPSQPAEGVNLQWSIDAGATWTNFPGNNQYPQGQNNYTASGGGGQGDDFMGVTTQPGTGGEWEPTSGGTHGGNYPPGGQPSDAVYYWHEYKSSVPLPATSANTRFRWAQLANSSSGFDAWGIDEVIIKCPTGNLNVIWSHGPTTLNPPSVTLPPQGANPYDTCFTVTVSDTINSATDSVCVTVNPIPQVHIGHDQVQPDMITYYDESVPGGPSVNILSRQWNFGTPYADPSTSNDSMVTVTYAEPGSFTTTLQVTNDVGCIDTSTFMAVITGITEEKSNHQIEIFPSVTEGRIMIKLPGKMKGQTEVFVFSMQGALVKRHTFSGKTSVQLNLGTLSAGTYILRVKNGESISHHKIEII